VYTITIDKSELFEATVNIEGADSSTAKCRLVVEAKGMSFLFSGTLNGSNCEIPIKKLKNYIQEGDRGMLRLEVIADDTYFSPWQSEFVANVSRKVTAEITEPKITKPTVVAEVVSPKKPNPKSSEIILIKKIAMAFKPYDIKVEDVAKRKKTINHVIKKLISEGVIPSDMKNDGRLVDIVLQAIVNNNKV
jgi:TusA-related sulfurtransferase